VAASGFFMWRRRSPSPRQLRFAWLTELVRAIHADSRGTYGWRRVNAELIYGHGGHCCIRHDRVVAARLLV
jgi:putative transposase